MRPFKSVRAALVGRRGVVSKKEIRGYLPPKPVIIEAGAHSGLDTVELAKVFPDARIFAFEPIPVLYRELERRTKSLANVQCFELALGRSNGSAEIHVSGGRSDGSSSLLRPKEHLRIHPDITFNESLEVETVNLDDWANGLEIDFLWLDLQGFELTVLEGSPRAVGSATAIYTEVNLVESYEKGPLYSEVRNWLEGRAFTVVKEAIPWSDGGNVLFVKEKRLATKRAPRR